MISAANSYIALICLSIYCITVKLLLIQIINKISSLNIQTNKNVYRNSKLPTNRCEQATTSELLCPALLVILHGEYMNE